MSIFTSFGASWVIKAGVVSRRAAFTWDVVAVATAASVGCYGAPVLPLTVVHTRPPRDAGFDPGGRETAIYLLLNERSGLTRPGKMSRLPGGDLNSPKRTTWNTNKMGGNGGPSTHMSVVVVVGGGTRGGPPDLLSACYPPQGAESIAPDQP